MNINNVSVKKSSVLDGIEVKSATFLNQVFPTHFHLDWSLAFIHHGSECISFKDQEFTLHKNAVILIPPHSLHANWGNEGNPWSYEALYLNEDVIKASCKELNIDYQEVSAVPYFVHYLDSLPTLNEECILALINGIFTAHCNEEKESKYFPKKASLFSDIIQYLSTHYQEKITLEKLEHKFHINKYKLLRNFRKHVGLSPLEYQMAIRIEQVKPLFYEDCSLAHIALDGGFYDQSHFTRCFKKYVGVTPNTYRLHCNILQDNAYSVR